MPNLDLDRVRGLIGENLLADASSLGDAVFVVQRQGIHAVLKSLRDDESLRFDMLIDLAGVDRLGLPNSSERFEIVYILYSMWNGWRLRLKVPVPESDPAIDSIDDLYESLDIILDLCCGNGELDPGEACDKAIAPDEVGGCPAACDWRDAVPCAAPLWSARGS